MAGDDFADLSTGPDLGEAGAYLRAAWRAEQEEAAEAAAEMWRHRRSLHDLLVGHMHRGDKLALTVARHRFVGEVVEVADDLVSLMTIAGRVDVQLHEAVPLMVQVTEAPPADGRSSGGPAGSFRARLLWHEAAGEEVTLGTVLSSEPFDGVLTVGSDQVGVRARGGAETHVRLSSVAYVMPRRA